MRNPESYSGVACCKNEAKRRDDNLGLKLSQKSAALFLFLVLAAISTFEPRSQNSFQAEGKLI